MENFSGLEEKLARPVVHGQPGPDQSTKFMFMCLLVFLKSYNAKKLVASSDAKSPFGYSETYSHEEFQKAPMEILPCWPVDAKYRHVFSD